MGRPKGRRNKLKPCRFDLTPAGYILSHQCEVEWDMLMKARECGARIGYRVLKTIGYSSDNPVFRTEEWRFALIDYKRYGLKTPNRVKEDLGREMAYIFRKLAKRLDG